MPDMEGFREASNFGFDQAQSVENFHVKVQLIFHGV